MKKKENICVNKKNWIISVVINAIVLVTVLLTTKMIYETNDDLAISCRIVDAYPYVNFVNYYLCKVLVVIQQMIPGLNAYIITQIILSFVCFVIVLKLILDNTENKMVRIIAAVTILMFSFDQYCTLQFTKSAALLLITALLMMMDTITKKRSVPYYIVTIVLLYFGVAFRIDGLPAAVGFAGLFLLFWMWSKKGQLKEEGYFNKKNLAIYAVLIALIGTGYIFDNASYKANISNAALREYKTYSICRSAVVDYPVYEYYEQNKKGYDEIGISENDLYLIDNWYFDYDGAASEENLGKIIEVDKQSSVQKRSVVTATKQFIKASIQDIKNLSRGGVHILFLVLLAVCGLLLLKPQKWFYIVCVGISTAMLHLAIYYIQRPAYRAIYIADLGAAIWLVYFYSKYHRETLSKRSVTVLALVTALSLTLLAPMYASLDSMYNKTVNKVQTAEMSQYFEKNKDSFFVQGVSEKKYSPSCLTPWLSPDTEAESNIMGTGSWGTKSPYLMDKLSVYGMTNPIKDLLDNENAYYVGNNNIDRLEEYYNKWYSDSGNTISMKKVDEVSGMSVWAIKSGTK